MKIELRQQVTRHVVSRREIRPPQYEILCDGRLIGHLPHAPGSRPLLICRLGPLEMQELNRIIRRKMHPHPVADAVQPPEEPRAKQDDHFDPFAALDESEAEV